MTRFDDGYYEKQIILELMSGKRGERKREVLLFVTQCTKKIRDEVIRVNLTCKSSPSSGPEINIT